MTRSFSELQRFETFEERFKYLKISSSVGIETFGSDRYLNQAFYHSNEWRRIRNAVILRDQGCDLGISDREIRGRIYIHHMNPVSIEDIMHSSEHLLDPEYLICVSFATHNAIHYGDDDYLTFMPTVRTPNDTCPWKR